MNRTFAEVCANAAVMKDGNQRDQLRDALEKLLPSGAGFDAGTRLLWKDSNDKKLVFETEFHHMNDNGFYDGWTQHRVTVLPTFIGLEMKISWRDKNDIEYIAEVFNTLLTSEVEWTFSNGEHRIEVK